MVGEFVVSGSDDGCWFIWLKKMGRLIKMLNGDENGVCYFEIFSCDCILIICCGIGKILLLYFMCICSLCLIIVV